MGATKTKGVRISSVHICATCSLFCETEKGNLQRVVVAHLHILGKRKLYIVIFLFFTTETFQFKISNVAVIFFLTYKYPVDNLIMVV